MNFVGSYYYRTHRIILTHLGLWPYYTRCANYIRCILLSPFLLSGIIFQLSVLITKEYSMDFFLNISSFAGPTMIYLIKYFVVFFKSNETIKLMKQIQHDWDSLKDKEELKIIHKRANIGKNFTFLIIILIYTKIFLCTLIFFWPNILDIMIPLNESRQSWNVLNPTKYFIDENKYIYLLIIYMFLIGFIGATVLLTLDSLTMMCIQHVCAMFQITSYRIECIVNGSQMKTLVISTKADAYKSIAKAIDSHQRAINFIDSMKSVYGTVYLLLIPVSVGTLSINLLRLCENVTVDTSSVSIILSFGYIVCHFGYIFLGNYFGQLVIDCSNDVFKNMCKTRWYATPLYMQRCLLMMMRRSMKNSTLMIGYIFLPSLEGFATLTNASLSYCMIIYSKRQS